MIYTLTPKQYNSFSGVNGWRIYAIYTDPVNNTEVREEIYDMYWFEENMVHNLNEQFVNGYGIVRFTVEPC